MSRASEPTVRVVASKGGDKNEELSVAEAVVGEVGR